MEEWHPRGQLEPLPVDHEGEARAAQGRPAPAQPAGGERRWPGHHAERGALLQALLENAASALLLVDQRGKVTYANPAGYRLFGYEREGEEMTGLPLSSLWPQVGASAELRRAVAAGLADGWRGEAQQRRKDGAPFQARLTVIPITDEHRRPVKFAIVVRDRTGGSPEPSGRERQEPAQPQSVGLITAVALEVSQAPTLRGLYRRLVTLVKERFGYYHVQLFRWDPAGDSMQLVARYGGFGRGERAAPTQMPYGKGVVGLAAATGLPVLVADASQDAGWISHPDLPDSRGELAVPIQVRDRVPAVLDILSDKAGALTEKDQVLMVELVGQLAALENARLLDRAASAREPGVPEDARASASSHHGALHQPRERVLGWLNASPRRRRSFWAIGALLLLLLGALGGWALSLTLHADTPAASAQVLVPATQPAGEAVLTPAPTATPAPLPLVTLSASHLARATATPVPIAPENVAPTPSPVGVVVPAPFAAVAAGATSNGLPVPPPVQPVPVAGNAINIVVLGSDRREDWTEWHTDAVHVVSIQPSSGAVSVLSIPRDLYLYIPSFWMSRINFADFYGEAYDYEGGGPALMRDTLLYNLGIRMDSYVRTDFDGLIGIVDTVGGVDIPVHCPLSDYWPIPDAYGQYHILNMPAGVHHMDGETALWYARSRKTTSVFSRERRQQQVLQAIWHQVRDTTSMSQVSALWVQGQKMVVTDITLAEVLQLAPMAFSMQDQNVRFYNIGAGQVTPWVTPYGGGVFLPRWDQIEPIVAEMMAPVPEARMRRTYTVVEVWNGTPNADWDLLVADRVSRAGFPVMIGQPDRQDYAETQLIVFSRRPKGTGMEQIQQMLGLGEDQVIYLPAETDEGTGFRLIVGADYRTCYQQ